MVNLSLCVTSAQIREMSSFLTTKEYNTLKSQLAAKWQVSPVAWHEWQVEWPNVHKFTDLSVSYQLETLIKHTIVTRLFFWWKQNEFDLREQAKERGLDEESAQNAVIGAKQYKLYTLVYDGRTLYQNWHRYISDLELEQHSRVHNQNTLAADPFGSIRMDEEPEIPHGQSSPRGRSRSPALRSRLDVVDLVNGGA